MSKIFPSIFPYLGTDEMKKKGNKEVNIERTEDIKETNTEVVATGCPFCNTMLTDGAKTIEEERKISVMDISELIAKAQDL